MKTVECVSCKWWRQHNGGEVGCCHRFPPMVMRDTSTTTVVFHTQFPVTSKTEWCGEFVCAKPDCADMSIAQLYRLIPNVIGRWALEEAGIKTVGQLITYTPEQLLELRQFGVTALSNVRLGLSQLGVALKGDNYS